MDKLGVPLTPEERIYNPQNVQAAVSLAQAGKRANMQSAGMTRRVQSTQDLGGGAVRMIFNDGTTQVVGPDEAEKILVDEARKRQIEYDKARSAARAGGTVTGRVGAEVDVLPDTLDIQEKTILVRGEAEAKSALDTADKIGAAQQKIAMMRETGVLDARDFNTLKGTSGARKRNIEKAKLFRDALQSGKRSSGVGRQAALYAPIGVWTDQGSFDEVFNSFAEIAAREKLKASGETRPTDADVQGMKQSMFGVGRSEAANIQMLNEFIAEQEELESSLRRATEKDSAANAQSEAGSEMLRGGESAVRRNSRGWPLMRDANGNYAYVGPNGEIEEFGGGL